MIAMNGRMEAEARASRERERAVPSIVERSLTSVERAEILKRVMDVQLAEGLSNRAVAEILGCSQGTWSQVRSGTYAGRVDRYLLRAEKWLQDRQQRREAVQGEYVETSIARAIRAVCERAWAMPTIGRVVTPSGCGKTVALREFARERGEGALLVQAGEFGRGVQGLLAEIARGLGIAAGSRSRLEVLAREVRDSLAKHYQGGMGSPFVLLVDEATTLSSAALNALRNLHDDPACRAAVVLADTWRLDAFLRNPHGIAGGNEQLRTRGGAAYLLREDAEIREADVRLVAESIVRGLGRREPLARESVKHLTRLAQGDGRLRRVYHRLVAAHDVASHLEEEPDYSPAQLDFVATLVGETCEMEHAQPPFARQGGLAATQRGARATA